MGGDLFSEDEPGTPQTTGTGLMGRGYPGVVQDASVVIKAPVGTTLESIPLPRPPAGEGELSSDEEETFEACKAGVDNLHKAFWIAGKALETMKAGNLHRNSGVPNFADFIWINWEISESHSQRLMAEWRIGEALASLGWKPRESQVRELTPVAKSNGEDAAVAVYDTLAREGGRVTSSALKDVVKQLPAIASGASPAEVVRVVRGTLELSRPLAAGGTGNGAQQPGHDQAASSANASEELGRSQKPDPTESEDVRRLMQSLALVTDAAKAINRPAVRRAIDEHPEAAMLVVKEIETTLGKIGRAIALRKPAV
ncbi:hypothetical protein OG612_42725 (plasmid) [Streptomyces sp. NBC_01527]|uniref:hypothetical protein n=1 Tax=unclassified Streptomyces TaxID=2593676 RepID=UPI002E0EB9C5|nr:hypothetical protein OG763_45485 [Streptomyces sp. NBC_01230]